MRWSGKFLLALFLLAALPAARAPAQDGATVYFGVLAFGGEAHARARWQKTADYLSGQLRDTRVVLVPLTLDGADAALEARGLHFLLTNPGHYQGLMQRHGLSPLVSLRTDAPRRVETGNRYGAVIFARAGPGAPQRLSDLKGTRFGAVAPQAFGGWQLALHTLRRNGLAPERDFAELRFFGFPQTAIVEAVLAEEIDAGTVRTGVLEAMTAEGRVAPGALVVLNPLEVPGFGLQLSTALVPEWLVAATPQAGPDLRRDLARALLAIEPADGPADGWGAGWLPPHSLAPVIEIRDALAAAPAPARRQMLLFAGLAALAGIGLGALFLRRRRGALSPHLAAPPAGATQNDQSTGPSAPLTPREAEILSLVEQGQTTKEIARALSISPKTVEFHRHNLMQKFEATNMADLVRRAGDWRRADPPEILPT